MPMLTLLIAIAFAVIGPAVALFFLEFSPAPTGDQTNGS